MNVAPASVLTTLGNRRTYLLRGAVVRAAGSQPMANVSRNSPTDLRVAVAGLGAIGTKVAEALDQGINGLALSAVSVQNPKKHRSWLGRLTSKPAVLPIEALSNAADIVIECAPSKLMRSIGAPFVERGKPTVVLSAGSLLGPYALIE